MQHRSRPLIRAQVLALVLRGFLQTRGEFFKREDVLRVARQLEADCTPQSSRPLRYNELPEGY